MVTLHSSAEASFTDSLPELPALPSRNGAATRNLTPVPSLPKRCPDTGRWRRIGGAARIRNERTCARAEFSKLARRPRRLRAPEWRRVKESNPHVLPWLQFSRLFVPMNTIFQIWRSDLDLNQGLRFWRPPCWATALSPLVSYYLLGAGIGAAPIWLGI